MPLVSCPQQVKICFVYSLRGFSNKIFRTFKKLSAKSFKKLDKIILLYYFSNMLEQQSPWRGDILLPCDEFLFTKRFSRSHSESFNSLPPPPPVTKCQTHCNHQLSVLRSLFLPVEESNIPFPVWGGGALSISLKSRRKNDEKEMA